MKQTKPLVITINRQLGCGGAFIGQQLAKRLNIFYADREIIRNAAEKLSVLEEDIDSREEKVPSFWDSLFRSQGYATDVYVPQKFFPPTDREVFDTQAEVIKHIANEKSAVIIGRCGFYLLRKHPNLVTIFLHADLDFRSSRIQDTYELSPDDALKMISQNDKGRNAYCKTFTGKDWSDARNYDLSIDTGRIGIEKTVELIINYLKIKGQ